MVPARATRSAATALTTVPHPYPTALCELGYGCSRHPRPAQRPRKLVLFFTTQTGMTSGDCSVSCQKRPLLLPCQSKDRADQPHYTKAADGFGDWAIERAHPKNKAASSRRSAATGPVPVVGHRLPACRGLYQKPYTGAGAGRHRPGQRSDRAAATPVRAALPVAVSLRGQPTETGCPRCLPEMPLERPDRGPISGRCSYF
jgi:hypothetical protein